MSYDEERKKLIEEAQEFKTFPPVDYSNMTNEQIKKRTEILRSAFEMAFKDREDDEYL